jgi:hypothetical protein
MPHSMATFRAQVPGGTGRAQTATSEKVKRTPRRGARHQATIRTTLWRHETAHRHHGTGAPQAASSIPGIAFHVLFGIPLRMGAALFPAATSEPFPLFRAHAHSVSPQSAFAVTPPYMRARSLRLTCAHGQGGWSVARRPCIACAFLCADADEEFIVRKKKPKLQPKPAQA